MVLAGPLTPLTSPTARQAPGRFGSLARKKLACLSCAADPHLPTMGTTERSVSGHGHNRAVGFGGKRESQGISHL
jgi:hypothetical protein